MKKFLLFFLLLFFCLSFAVSGQTKIKDLKPTVILVSLDGFRADYLEKYRPEVLTKLAVTGVRAKWMTPSFPSKTFPNHYAIATGLYPEHNGIVENNVYDYGTVFSMGNREEVLNPRWWLGEPIWVTAQKQGQIAASYFFPGTDTAIGGLRPIDAREYNGKVPNELRVDKILALLDLPIEKRPTMLTLYFSDTDDTGHEFSPDSEELAYAVKNVDRDLGRLMDGLQKRGIDEQANVIVVSDHGMATVDMRQKTFLDDYFSFDLAEKILWTNEIIQIFPKPGSEEAIYAKINALPHTTCWRKKDIPARLDYQDSPRIAPIVCSSEEGWVTTNHKRYDDWVKDADDVARPRGAHGYDNRLPSMRAVFIAHGSAFKKGYLAEPFKNVEVYNLMCKVLNLKPAKNDGNLENIKNLLK